MEQLLLSEGGGGDGGGGGGGGGGAGDGVDFVVSGGAAMLDSIHAGVVAAAVVGGGGGGVVGDGGESMVYEGNPWKGVTSATVVAILSYAGSNKTSQERIGEIEGGGKEVIPAVILYTGGFIMLMATVAGLCGNLAILAALWHRKHLKNVINIFVASLCINDVMNLLLNNAMVIVSYFSGYWPSNLLHCELLAHSTVLLMGCSLWHTGLIAVHRFLVVVCNQFYVTMSKNVYTVFVLTFSRIVPLCFLLNPDLGNMVEYEPKLLRCLVKEEFVMFKTLVSIVLMIIPSFIVVVCYVAIFTKSYISSAALRSSQSSEWLKREIQITKMFGLVFLVIYVGYIPYGVIRSIDRQLQYSGSVYAVITVLYAVANTVNPIIYGAMDRRIYKACINMFCNFRQQARVQVQDQERMQLHSLQQLQLIEIVDTTNSNHVNGTQKISHC